MRGWKVCSTSIRGKAHEESGMPCQDSCRSLIIKNGKLEYLIAVVSDGCGSASSSEIGASLVTEEIIDCLSFWLSKNPPTYDLSELIRFAMGHARISLTKKADQLGIRIVDMACTCLCIIAGPHGFAAGQIGDGVIVGTRNEVSGCIFWPNQEYANVTHTLGDRNWHKHVQSISYITADPFDAWFLATDGIQAISCNSATKVPHSAFVSSLQQKLKSIPSGQEHVMSSKLCEYLKSEKVNAVVNDDKTILIACK